MQKLELDLNKFPHVLSIKQRINELTSFIEKLNKRKVLIQHKEGTISEFEANEDELLLIQTDWDLAKSHKSLAEKTQYVREFIERLDKYIPEINENYEKVINKARNFISNNFSNKNHELFKSLEQEFKQVSTTDLNENWEARIKHYIVLKSLLENKKDKK